MSYGELRVYAGGLVESGIWMVTLTALVALQQDFEAHDARLMLQDAMSEY